MEHWTLRYAPGKAGTEMTAITLPCYTQEPKLEFNNRLIRLHPFTCDTEHNLVYYSCFHLCYIAVVIIVLVKTEIGFNVRICPVYL